MRRRPWALVILAIFHFFAPIGNIVFNAIISKRDLGEYFIMAMSPQYIEKNWIMLLMPLIAGAAIYACKKWSFYVYMVAITVLFGFSYIGYMSKVDELSIVWAIFAYLINISIVIYFLIPAVRNVYFDRRMRWWEIQPRYECDYKAEWKFEDDFIMHPGEIGNISVNGLFLKSPIMPKEQDIIQITIPFDNQKTGQFKGKVIFHGDAKTFGFGVQFEHTKESKQVAQDVAAFLEKQGKQSNRIQLRPEDSLSFWVRTLVTTGRGLVPKTKK